MKIILKQDSVAKIGADYVNHNLPLILQFESCYDLSKAIIHLQNGALKSKQIPFNRVFEVPKEFLFEGKLFIQVDMIIDGKVVKKWQVPPIRIIEQKEEILFYPELDYLNNMLEEIKKEVTELKNNLLIHIQKSNEII
jgi:hypothetical protein